MMKDLVIRLKKSATYQYLDNQTRKILEQKIISGDEFAINEINSILNEEDQIKSDLNKYLDLKAQEITEKVSKDWYAKLKREENQQEEAAEKAEDEEVITNLLKKI